MAKKNKGAEAEEGTEKKKKKPIVPIVLVVVGVVAGKMFFGGGGEKSAADLVAEKKAAEAALMNLCASWNGGVRPAHEGAAAGDTQGDGESKGAAANGTTTVRLISTGGTTVELAAGAEEGKTPTTETTEPVKPGPVIELPSTTINLADGRYLKVGFALQMPEGADAKLAKEEGKGARAADIAISRLQGMTMKQLMPPSARIQTKHEIGADVCAAYEGEILTLYFTEFVMQ